MKSFKGQSAVEYVTTYGWAIFALVFVIAVLFGSGMLSSNFFIQEKCELGANMPCRLAMYNDASGQTKVSFEMLNGFAYPIKITKVELLLPEEKVTATGLKDNLAMDSGANASLQGVFPTKVADNSLKQLTITVTYVSCAPELGGCTDPAISSHTVTGTSIARVIPGT